MVSAALRGAREPPDDRPEPESDRRACRCPSPPATPPCRRHGPSPGRRPTAASDTEPPVTTAPPEAPPPLGLACPGSRDAHAPQRSGPRSDRLDPVRAGVPWPRPVVLRRAHARLRPAARSSWSQLWPVFLIVIGLWVVLGSHAPRIAMTERTRARATGSRATDPRPTGSAWPIGDGGSRPSTPRSARCRRRIRRRRSPTGARSASGCSGSIPSRRSRPRRRAASGRATSSTTRGSGSTRSWSRRRPRSLAPCRSSCRTAAPTASRSAGSGSVRLPFPEGERTLSVFWMAGYCRRALPPVPRRHERLRDLWRGSLPGRRGQGRRPRRRSRSRPGDLGTHPRLQLRDAAVVRLRPALGVSACPAREPPRPRGPRRRAADVTATPARVRLARPDDAEAIADAHVRGWLAAYRGLVPDAILDGLSVERRATFWRDTIAAEAAAKPGIAPRRAHLGRRAGRPGPRLRRDRSDPRPAATGLAAGGRGLRDLPRPGGARARPRSGPVRPRRRRPPRPRLRSRRRVGVRGKRRCPPVLRGRRLRARRCPPAGRLRRDRPPRDPLSAGG